eukprot:TRINITY_DN10925_c0_g1_i1.p1 TRINITY_DN10925_c0_g1~~TRINITY_DN10925_c0_g1_i1.p1  ORF type:complete len:580 (+),score=121.76 TRINITY_DN10925_c0_g1_i1:25-1764(+)
MMEGLIDEDLKENGRSLYEVLGINRNASLKEIKTAYRKKARQYHPDKNIGDENAQRKISEVNLAYEILSDPMKRKIYDKLGTTGLKMYESNENDGLADTLWTFVLFISSGNFSALLGVFCYIGFLCLIMGIIFMTLRFTVVEWSWFLVFLPFFLLDVVLTVVFVVKELIKIVYLNNNMQESNEEDEPIYPGSNQEERGILKMLTKKPKYAIFAMLNLIPWFLFILFQILFCATMDNLDSVSWWYSFTALYLAQLVYIISKVTDTTYNDYKVQIYEESFKYNNNTFPDIVIDDDNNEYHSPSPQPNNGNYDNSSSGNGLGPRNNNMGKNEEDDEIILLRDDNDSNDFDDYNNEFNNNQKEDQQHPKKNGNHDNDNDYHSNRELPLTDPECYCGLKYVGFLIRHYYVILLLFLTTFLIGLNLEYDCMSWWAVFIPMYLLLIGRVIVSLVENFFAKRIRTGYSKIDLYDSEASYDDDKRFLYNPFFICTGCAAVCSLWFILTLSAWLQYQNFSFAIVMIPIYIVVFCCTFCCLCCVYPLFVLSTRFMKSNTNHNYFIDHKDGTTTVAQPDFIPSNVLQLTEN